MASTVSESYDLASCPPKDNHVIIFSHYKYKNLRMTREGTHEDMNRLCEFFNYLQYTVFPYQDLTYDEIKKKLQHHSSTGHAPLGSLILVVMTHGSNDGLLWAQDRDYKAHDIWEPFIDCPSLKDRPKVFVFQACRGKKIERRMMTDAGPDQLEPLRLPHASGDVLLAYSTVEDYVSWRDTHKGSPYIQALCDELWKWPGGMVDILTVLTKVTDRVVSEEISTKPEEGQTPVFRSYLDRLVINTQMLPSSARARQAEILQGFHGGPRTSSDVTLTDQAEGLPKTVVGNIITDASQGVVTRDLQYPMTQGGCAIIYFDRTHLAHSRDLQNVLLKCNFPVVARSEISNDGSFIDYITKDVESMNLKDHSFLLVVVLAPMNEDQVEVSSTSVSTCQVTSLFVASTCTDLKNKPKIFFFVDQRNKNCSKRFDGPPLVQDTPRTLTDHSDFLIVRATGEGFLTELYSQLQLTDTNLVSIIRALTTVFKKARSNLHNPNMESTLRRDVIFGSPGTELFAKTAWNVNNINIDMNNIVTVYKFPEANYYGRKIEQDLFKEQLLKKRKFPINIAVTGLPGAGKTELVRKCIHEFEELRDEDVVWIDSSTPRAIDISIQQLKTDHNVELHKDLRNILTDIYNAVKEKARIRGNKKIIVVFDDIHKFSDIEKLLPPYSTANSFAVVVTSNQRAWDCDLEIPLNYFTTKECFEYFQNNCTLGKYDQLKLVNLLWNCPSELKVAVDLIKEKQNFPGNKELAAAYIETILQQGLRQGEWRNKILLNSVQKVEWYLQSTVDILKAVHTRENAGMTILQNIALLDEDKISMKIFSSVLKGNENMQSALVVLKNSSVINYDGQYLISEPLIRFLVRQKTENATCVIKDLLSFFKSEVDTSAELLTLRSEHYWCYIKNILLYAISQGEDFKDLPTVAIAALNVTNKPNKEQLCFLKIHSDKLENMINTEEETQENNIVLFHQYLQLLHNFKFFRKTEKAINKFLLSPNGVTKKHPSMLKILCLKVQNLCTMEQWEEALPLYSDICSRIREHLSENNKLTRKNLVNICITAAQLSKCIHVTPSEVFQSYMSMWKERLCKIETQPDAADDLQAVCKAASTLREHKYNILAVSLCDYIMEHIPERFKTHQHVLELQHHKTWSFDVKDISITKWQKCLELYKEQVKLLGMEHEDTTSSIRNLGCAAVFMDKQNNESIRWKNYLQLWTERFEILQMTLEDLDTLRDTMQSLKDKKCQKEVISLCDHAMKHLPPGRKEEQHVLGMLHQKARSLCDTWQYKEAWSLWQDVYRRQVKALGMDHEDTRDTIMEMVETVDWLEEEDFKCYLDIWSVRFQHVTQDQLELLLETLNSLDCNRVLRLSLCDLALSLIPDHLCEHRHTLQIMYWKCKSLYHLKREAESWQLFQDLYWRQVRVLGMTHEDTMNTMGLMGRSAENLDGKNIDRDPWRTYLGLWKQMLEQPDIDIEYMFYLVCRYGSSSYDLQMCEVLFDVLKSSRGEKHHLTLRAQLEKARVLWWFDRRDEAWQLYLDVCQLYGEQPQDRPDDQFEIRDVIKNLKEKIIKESDSEW